MPFIVHFSGLELALDLPALDQIDVTFGGRQASEVAIVSSNSSFSLLRISAPPCQLCTFSSGQHVAVLRVALKSNQRIQGWANYVYWAAPRILAASFDSAGTVIHVRFDTDTNRGEMLPSNTDCSTVFDAATLAMFGNADVSCVWPTDRLLYVALGVDATVLPLAHNLGWKGGILRSQNGLSPAVPALAVNIALPSSA
eukprot:2488055-Rhodomonas_salina.1